MPELPIYPDGRSRREAPGYELERRLLRASGLAPAARLEAQRKLRLDAVRETLRLTGAPDEDPESGLFIASREALELIERSASPGAELSIELIQEVQRRANPPSSGHFRTSELPPQFKNTRLASPRWIPSRLENLLDWLQGESGMSMFPAERMALWFPRFLEISPFERGNFRTAHLFLSFFSCASSFPPVTLRLEEAEEVRSEIERALLFDTYPLVQRFSRSLLRSLEGLENER